MKFFTSSDGLRLAYREDGTGLPLICLPGLTRNGRDFEPLVTRFAERARIIRLDLRGRGDSDHDPNYSNYNIFVEGRDVLELMNHLGLESAAILGTSRGGLVALALATLAKERLLGVMFNDVGPEADPAGMAVVMKRLGIQPSFDTLEEAAVANAKVAGEAFPGVDVAKWKWFLGNGWLETPTGIRLRYDMKLRDAVAEALAAEEQPDLWSMFDMLEGVPLALLRGENSDILSIATTAKMRERRPDMAFTLVADRGHIPFLDEPESVAAIDAFLTTLAASSR